MEKGKLELFMVTFIAALVLVPLVDYIYDMLGPKLGLPSV